MIGRKYRLSQAIIIVGREKDILDEEVIIRAAEKADLPFIVELHSKYISWGFLSSLGERTLYLIYESLIEFSGGKIIVGIENNEVIGFVTGVTRVSSLYMNFLRKKLFRASWTLLYKLANLSTFRKVLETLFYPLRKHTDTIESELLSIVVAEEYQGKGIADLLFEGLETEFREMGISRFKTSVGYKNKRSCAFFEKMGCKQVGEFEIHKGEASRIYVYSPD